MAADPARLEGALGRRGQVGRVLSVKAERNRDIFNGFTYFSGLALPRYLPAEDIAEIRHGVVELKPGAPVSR